MVTKMTFVSDNYLKDTTKVKAKTNGKEEKVKRM
jgi:hypothetical protein